MASLADIASVVIVSLSLQVREEFRLDRRRQMMNAEDGQESLQEIKSGR